MEFFINDTFTRYTYSLYKYVHCLVNQANIKHKIKTYVYIGNKKDTDLDNKEDNKSLDKNII